MDNVDKLTDAACDVVGGVVGIFTTLVGLIVTVAMLAAIAIAGIVIAIVIGAITAVV